jgi:hypothetical protein
MGMRQAMAAEADRDGAQPGAGATSIMPIGVPAVALATAAALRID